MAQGRILIVGGGIAGLCTAWALARRGYAVELFERGDLPNQHSSSCDEHRIIRHAYGEMAGYGALMPAAFEAWRRLSGDLGARHLEPMPAYYALRGEDDWYETTRRSLRRMGVGCAEIPLSEVADTFPMLRTDGLTRMVRTEGAGVLYAARILADLANRLPALGVRLHPRTAVHAVDCEAGTVATAAGTVRGDRVVVAAGAWVADLLPELAGVAVPSRQAVMYLAPPPHLAAAWRDAPVLIDIGGGGGTYTIPPRPGTRLKIGDHVFSRIGHPDDDRAATPGDLDRLVTVARRSWHDFDRYTVLERRICYYTATVDERFLVRAEGARGIVCSACSGHGFKLAPLVADRIAATIASERELAALPDWAAARDAHGIEFEPGAAMADALRAP